MSESAKQPRFLLWLDLETTGLDPRESGILEIAFRLTSFRYPYEEVDSGSFLVSGPATQDLFEGRCSEFIASMHAESGLTEALKLAFRTTLSNIELFFSAKRKAL